MAIEPEPQPRDAKSLGAALALAGGFVLYALYLNHQFTIDDSFIIYHYARNIAEGLGPVYSPGEYVEGFTCFLWTYLLAGVSWLGFDLVVAAPVVGTALSLIALYHVHQIGQRVAGPRCAWVAAILAASSGPLALWAAQGLETPLFASTLLAGIHADLRERDGERARIPRSAVWFGLAAMTRPEGVFAFLFAASLRTWECYQERLSKQRWLVYGLTFAAFLGPLLIWRWITFGDLVPNTYYTKAHGNPIGNARRGLEYFRLVFSDAAGWPGSRSPLSAGLGFVLLFGVPVSLGLLAGREARRVALYAGLYTSAILFEGGDWMPAGRFFVPVLPLLFVLVAAIARQPDLSPRVARSLAVALAIWVAVVGTTSAGRRRNGPRGTVRDGRGLLHCHKTIALWLKAQAHPGDEVAAGDIGYIAYYSRLPLFDLLGLVDKELSRMPGQFPHKEIAVERLFERDPAFVVLIPALHQQAKLLELPRFQERYRFVFRRNVREYWLPQGVAPYYLYVFVRSNHPALNASPGPG